MSAVQDGTRKDGVVSEQLSADERDRLAKAWDEGHRTHRKLGPDGCRCEAWNESQCGCGLYGTNIVTPNPYRVTP